jgi:hypothetical protein
LQLALVATVVVVVIAVVVVSVALVVLVVVIGFSVSLDHVYEGICQVCGAGWSIGRPVKHSVFCLLVYGRASLMQVS